MKNIVITIARQYGSGGRTVGQMLAKRAGIHYYDKELMKLAAEESGISEKLFVQADESVKKLSPLARLSKKVYQGELLSPSSDDFTSSENLFNYQAKIIKQLAEMQSCVIVGRCADYILRDCSQVVSCFVHAPMDFLMEQAADKQSARGHELEKLIAQIDRHRAAYYEYHTGQTWSDARNYDLCLDSSRLGFEKTVEEIMAYARVRFGENIWEEIEKEDKAD
jgi:cytidylate kinase